MYETVCKLKLLKDVFRQQKRLKGNLTDNVRQAKNFLDKAQVLFTTYKEDIFLELVKSCRRVYSVAVKLEISMLQQRAKLRWLKHGDQSSKIFFRKVNATRAKQRIFQITKVDGELVTVQQDVNQEFISYFQNLFGGPSLHRSIDLEFLRPELKHTITTAEASLLVTPVTLSEVKNAFFDIDAESAPGPDGYTSAFYRNAWPVIGQTLFQAVDEFFRTGKMLKQINTTLISLIPKVSLPRYVSDYRPIACCNVLYKSITKIIVKRLQQVLPLLIDYSQNAFVPGRSITDNILLAQELLAASFSVSLNGSIHGFFKGGRGLRQGDPMSPYLFVLVMEIWNLLLKFRIKEAADFQYHWKCKDIGLINLCFADDVLLFCKAHLPSIIVISDTLNEFAALSGLKVNPAKSQIIFSRAVQQERQQILDYLGFQEGSLPVKYLGIPLTSSRLTIADCRPLIDKVDTRLAGWNNQILSYAGRLQLIKSVLSTLHTYWTSAFILPKGVLKTLEKKMRQFLWQGSAGRGNAKVAWEVISKPKEEGGLGIRRLTATNQALMLKQLWRILQNDGTSIWVDWIQRYRLRHSTIWTFNGALGSWGWKKMLKLRPLFQRGVIYQIGDGSSFSLWQDPWHERGPLCFIFPQGPEAIGLPLSSPLSSVIRRHQWCWPASTDTEFIGLTSQLPPLHSSAADSISWRSSSGKFTVSAAVSLLQPTTPRVLWYVLLQGTFKIPRHGFILWMAILEKLSTMDKPWVPRAENGCVLCGGLFDETHDHLFFKCSYSKRCLSILRRKIRFQWPFLEWQTGLIWASKRWRGTHLINAAFRATLAALVYHLWAERNNRKFAATSASAEYITSRVLDDIRMRILAADCPPSLQSTNLYRIWHLARPIGL
ncbi:UNVERIFIED_CONTAM: putative ribonuclease H protein [Sesamum calycinum]|uniref:Ribonuclease H protein n=1 Tax=Sesamum calycinum TaxID=2727403 RepID=A0AAW2JN16_9LAMI